MLQYKDQSDSILKQLHKVTVADKKAITEAEKRNGLALF
jgi:hypothetical protein